MASLTDTEYAPEDALRELLIDAGGEITIRYDNEHEMDLGPITAVQRDYAVNYEGYELSGTETESALGVMLSLDGHLGLAATTILVSSIEYGEPQLLYLDEAPPADSWGERYQDISAEWYQPEAAEQGIPDRRMDSRADEFDADEIGLGQLEEWAEAWLSLDSTQ